MEQKKHKKRILIFIPAFNVEKEIPTVLDRIPNHVFDENFIKLLIIEDFSKDRTVEVIDKYFANSNKKEHINIIKNKKNYGYGGVQKIAFKYAIENNFDFAIMLHGDGQYAPEKIPDFILNLLTNKDDAVFGSRLINPKDALSGGMPFYKFVANRSLTIIQNLILGTKMSEFHSGYRSYNVQALKKINFERNTNDFHFDTEIIIQMNKLNFSIKEIAMPTYYGDEVSHLRSIPYGINVLISTIKYKFFYKD
jgi:glycosyltransferase involved in cell wall biosynthesis